MWELSRKGGTGSDEQSIVYMLDEWDQIATEYLLTQERPPKLLGGLTCGFSVELPGIEPGSYGIPSRLLRAQFTVSLLGSLSHVNKLR